MALQLVGPERQINFADDGVTNGLDHSQWGAAVAALPNGNFVVVYTSPTTSNSTAVNLYAHYFDPLGAPINPPVTGAGVGSNGVLLVDNTTLVTVGPDVVSSPDNGFVVVYTESGIPDEIRARRFDPATGTFTSDFEVSDAGVFLRDTKIARFANGNYIATWGTDLGGPTNDIEFAIINPAVDGLVGSIQGYELNTTDSQAGAEVATSGNVALIVLHSNTAGNFDIAYQLVDQNGAALQIGTIAGAGNSHNLTNPDVAALTDGRFVVVWQDGTTDDAFGAFYDPSTHAISDAFSIASGFFLTSPAHLTVAGLPAGGFLVTWDNIHGTLGDSSNAIYARRFDANGNPAGAEFLVNTNAAGAQHDGTAAANALGNAFVVWHDSATTSPFSTDTDPYRIQGQALLDMLELTPNDDSFTAPAGGVNVNGLAGIDTVTFGFKLIDATISFSGNNVIVDGPGSHTVLRGFEVFKFTDGTVNNVDGNPLVDDLYYYAKYHDVWNAHVDADEHFATFGWHEGRDPNALFDTKGYLATYGDVKAANVNPLEHYHAFGWKEGRDPSTAFDTAAYLATYADVKAAGVDPLRHFLEFGRYEERSAFADGVLG